MTTANKVTVVRILLIPFFVAEVLYYGRTGMEVYRYLALVCFGVAAVCDGIDGYIARHFHQCSELGAILDPLADKLLLVSGIIVLSFDPHRRFVPLPLWLAVTVVGRDVLLLLGLGVVQFVIGRVVVRPRMIGKVATVLQMSVVLWVLLLWPRGGLTGLALAAALCTAISGLLYIRDGLHQLGEHPAASAQGGATG